MTEIVWQELPEQMGGPEGARCVIEAYMIELIVSTDPVHTDVWCWDAWRSSWSYEHGPDMDEIAGGRNAPSEDAAKALALAWFAGYKADQDRMEAVIDAAMKQQEEAEMADNQNDDMAERFSAVHSNDDAGYSHSDPPTPTDVSPDKPFFEQLDELDALVAEANEVAPHDASDSVSASVPQRPLQASDLTWSPGNGGEYADFADGGPHRLQVVVYGNGLHVWYVHETGSSVWDEVAQGREGTMDDAKAAAVRALLDRLAHR